MTGNGSVQREYPSTVKRAAITLLGSGWEHTDLDTSGEARWCCAPRTHFSESQL